MGLNQVTPFIESKPVSSIDQPGTYLIGFGFDGTTSFRPGSRFGPRALREASENLENYSPYLDKQLDDYPIYDLGDLDFFPSRFDLMIQQFEEILAPIDLKECQVKLVTLGGEHSIAIAPLKLYLEQFKELVVIQLDAHADLRDGYLGNPHSHASIIRRTLDHFKPEHQLIQYGIRSGTKEEFNWMKEQKTLATSLEELIQRVDLLSDQIPLYLTLDLDFFDPSFLPGTGTPEAGGESFHSFIKLMKVLNRKNLVGADVCELAPQLDPTGNSDCFASKVTREILLALN